MRQKSLGASERLQYGRKLGCERLEQRALLAGLIGAAEIGPLPVEEFKMQADSFVTSTLDHVLATQNQKPVNFSKENSVVVTDDGRSARLTYYTVELDTPRFNPGTDNAQLGGPQELTPVTISGGTTRSDLVFSFLIYADNSVSIRAKLYNPPDWIGYSPSNFELHERLRLRNTIAENESLSTQSPAKKASDVSESIDGIKLAQELSESSQSTSADWRRDVAQVESEATDAALDAGEFETLSKDMFWLAFADSEVASAERRESGGVELPPATGPAAGEPENDFETHLVTELDSAGLPVPAGMIPLDYVTEAALQQTVASAPPASAIYQVFVHSADGSQLAAAGGAAVEPLRPASAAAQTAQEALPSRWRSTTVAMASLLGGLAWGLRARREEPAAGEQA